MAEVGVEDATLAVFVEPGDGMVAVFCDEVAEFFGEAFSFEVALLVHVETQEDA